MTILLSSEADDILERLEAERINHLYHWTSLENLSGISRIQQICSKKVLDDYGLWPPPQPGGNTLSHSLDQYNDNWNKVCLNFTPHTPMVYHKKRHYPLCFLLIDKNVATWLNVEFSDTNSAAANHEQQSGLNGLDLINFDAIHSDPMPWDKENWHKPVQAEVLIPDNIPLSYVEKVVFISQASLKEGERLWGPYHHPFFESNPGYFADGPRKGTPVAFSYLQNLILTDIAVDISNANSHFGHRNNFIRSQVDKITMVAELYALAGTTAHAIWGPGKIAGEETSIYQSKNYIHWSSINTDDLPNGLCNVNYYINKTRWAQIDFELIDNG